MIPFFCFFLISIADGFAPVDLAALDLFGLKTITVYRFGENWLLCHQGKDPALVLVDESGEPTATYRVAGDGPKELHQPYVIGIRGEQLFVRTSHFATGVFGPHLQILQQGPRLPRDLAQIGVASGTWVWENLFIRSNWSSQKGLIRAFFLEGDSWIMGKTYLHEFPAEIHEGYAHQIHDNLHAVSYTKIFKDPGTYSLTLFSLSRENTDLQFEKLSIIEGELSDLPPVFPKLRPSRNFKIPWALLGATCRTPTGFLVQIWSRNPEDGETIFYWGDSFDTNFVFQGRTFMGTKLLVPAVNDTAVFVLDTEEETLSRLY